MKRVLGSLILAVVMGFGVLAEAKSPMPTKYSCGNVGGTAEWTISVDFGAGLASFFDNDTESVAKLTAVNTVKKKTKKGTTKERVYVFEGNVGDGGPDSEFVVEFNITRMTAKVTFNPGGEPETTLRAYDKCVVAPWVSIEKP